MLTTLEQFQIDLKEQMNFIFKYQFCRVDLGNINRDIFEEVMGVSKDEQYPFNSPILTYKLLKYCLVNNKTLKDFGVKLMLKNLDMLFADKTILDHFISIAYSRYNKEIHKIVYCGMTNKENYPNIHKDIFVIDFHKSGDFNMKVADEYFQIQIDTIDLEVTIIKMLHAVDDNNNMCWIPEDRTPSNVNIITQFFLDNSVTMPVYLPFDGGKIIESPIEYGIANINQQ